MSLFLVFLTDLSGIFVDLNDFPLDNTVDWRDYDVFSVYVMATNQIDARHIAMREIFKRFPYMVSDNSSIQVVGCIHIHEN